MKINGLGIIRMDSDAPNINKIGARRVSCVLDGILCHEQRTDGETYTEWCWRSLPGLVFSPRQIIDAAVADTNGELWDEPGVYFLVWDGQIVYVGRSVSVGKRLREHRKEGRPFQQASAIIGLCDVGMREVEDAYVRALMPPWNEKATEGYEFARSLRDAICMIKGDGVMPWHMPIVSGQEQALMKKWQLHVLGRQQYLAEQ